MILYVKQYKKANKVFKTSDHSKSNFNDLQWGIACTSDTELI